MKQSLFNSGIRPTIDAHLLKLAEEKRDYGNYWSASSAGYCMRKNIFERQKIPYVSEDARKQRVFSAGDVFHEWIQKITLDSGLSIAQEIKLQDEDLMIRGHADDLVVIDEHLILYDYKSAHSRSFHYSKNRPMSHYHKMQLGTYMYMLRQKPNLLGLPQLTEARILKISKDDLCLAEHQLMWSAALQKEVVGYWDTLNGYWRAIKIPKCTCDKYEGGFMAKELYNPYFYEGEPCSLKWYNLKMDEKKEVKE